MLHSLAMGRAPAPLTAGLAGDLAGRTPVWLGSAGALFLGFPIGMVLGRRRRRAA